MKSSAMWDHRQEGTVSGHRSPADSRWDGLPLVQTVHLTTNLRKSQSIEGHQKLRSRGVHHCVLAG